MTIRAIPFGAGGERAERGRVLPTRTVKSRDHLPVPDALALVHRWAVCQGTTTSARTSRLPGATRRRRIAVLMPNGGFATTRKGRLGSRRSAASVTTMVTGWPANRDLRLAARWGWSSTAMTWAPRLSRGSVRAPVPAPMSTTRSPARIPASATICLAQWLLRRCHPQRVRSADTTHHREDHQRSIVHASTVRQNLSGLVTTPLALSVGQDSEAAQESEIDIDIRYQLPSQ